MMTYEGLIKKITRMQRELNEPWQKSHITDFDYYQEMVTQAAQAAKVAANKPKPDPIKTLDTTELIFELMERGFAVYKIPEEKAGGISTDVIS